ncbi:MAG: DUF2066 domain-containing protein [Maricaulaceae bacterium]
MAVLRARLKVAVVAACAAAGLAQAQDLFTVTGVRIDAEAASTAEARDRAIAGGLRLSAQRLFERLTLADDRAELDLSVPASDVQRWAAGMQIADERRSGRRYLGVMTVSFDAGPARAHLRARGAPFVEARGPARLLLPVWYDARDGSILWRENPWAAAWALQSPQNDLSPFITPFGELEDTQTLSPQAAQSLNVDAIWALAERYDLPGAIVARAMEGPDADTDSDTDAEPDGGLLSAEPPPDLTAGVTDGVDPADAAGLGFIARAHEVYFDDELGAPQVRDLGVVRAADLEALARQIAHAAQRSWKVALRVDPNQAFPRQTAALVRFETFDQWRAARVAIGGASLVRDARLDAVTTSGALMQLSYVGAPEQVAVELAAAGWVLEAEDRPWTIRPIP